MAKSITSYYLIATLLMTMMYIPIYTHTCHIFNKSKTSIFASPSCCGEKNGKEKLDINCCSMSIKTLVVEQDFEVEKNHSSDIIVKLVAQIEDFAPKITCSFHSKETYSRPPPLKSSWSSLAMNQTFRV